MVKPKVYVQKFNLWLSTLQVYSSCVHYIILETPASYKISIEREKGIWGERCKESVKKEMFNGDLEFE